MQCPIKEFALSAWLATVTPRECWENRLRAASGPKAVWMSQKVCNVPCRSQGREMCNGMRKARAFRYQATYSKALLVGFLCYQAFPILEMVSCS